MLMAALEDLMQWSYDRRGNRMSAHLAWPGLSGPCQVRLERLELASLLVQAGSHFEEALRHPEGLPLLLASCVQGSWKARYYEYFLAKL